MNSSSNGTILYNANILTMDHFSPLASWVMVQNGMFLRIGKGQKWKSLKLNHIKCIDLKGKTVLPGFIDCHQHFVSYAKSLISLNCNPGNNILSVSDLQALIRRYSLSKPAGQWILGRGYNEFHLTEKRHPRRWDLDQVSVNHPVRLTHQSGHVHALNTLALKEVGIGKETPDPPGGIIERDLNTGEPTGLLYEMGGYLSQRTPPLEVNEMQHGVRVANENLISMGITSIQDASSKNDAHTWEQLASWKESDVLQPRVSMMLGYDGFQHQFRHLRSNLDQSQLGCRTIKIILDETTGRLQPRQQELQKMVLDVHTSGFQVALHALEEKAIQAACDAIEYALEKEPRRYNRHRIEHCSVCPPALIKRIAALRILVVTQPPFIYFNGERYVKTVPVQKLPHLYPLKSLLEHGVQTAGSSDCPVVSPDPLRGIQAAVTRKSESGYYCGKQQRIERLQALKMYTQTGSLSTFEEGLKGSITPGKAADLVILNADPTKIPADACDSLRVEKTIINGRMVWQREGSDPVL